MKKPLTAKQEAFVQEYCSNGYNGTQAAIKAGYSVNTAKNIACENLSKPYIKARIDAYKAELSREHGYTVEQCQKEYEEIRQAAIAAGQLSAAATAVTGKARLYGMDKQTQVTEHVEPEPTADEAEALKTVAESYKLKLVKGTG
jgi:phage terminase small subunit